MLRISREVSRSLFELTHAAPREFERTLLGTHLFQNQPKPPADQFRLGSACGLFQISEDYPILFGETRVYICLHSASVAQLADLCYSAAMGLPMLFDDLF